MAKLKPVKLGVNRDAHFTDGMIDGPTWDDVEREIRALDGQRQDQVFVVFDDEEYLGVCGGNGGYYVTCAMRPDGEYALANPTRPADQTVWVMNGQGIDYVLSHTTDLKTALAAARWYYDHGGELAPALTWEKY
jgi:hypothetical protein